MSSYTEPLEYELIPGHRNLNPLYRITKEFTYAVGNLHNPIATFTVPKGYVTDLASIPFFLHWLFRPNGPWAKAAALHDFIYGELPHISKEVADGIFLEAMIVTKVNPIIAHLFFFVLRIYIAIKH